MNHNVTIKNFRVFDEEGASFELSPITILTGCNSAGKSSFVKGLLLVSDYLSSLAKDSIDSKEINLDEHFLDFTKRPNNLLGKFAKVVNNKSADGIITFGITAHSLMLCDDVYIEMSFCGTDKDDYTNGMITSFSISKSDGTVIYSDNKENGISGNLYSVFQEFIRFTYTEHYLQSYRSIEIGRELDGIGGYTSLPEDGYNIFTGNMKKYFTDVKNAYGIDFLFDINKWSRMHSSEGKSFLDTYSWNHAEIIEKVRDTEILYYLPVLDTLKDLSNDEVVRFFENFVSEHELDAATVDIFNKVISDFTKSEKSDFAEYYKTWEVAYLSDISKHTVFPRKEKSPSLFKASFINTCGDSTLCSPYNDPILCFRRDDDMTEIHISDKEKQDRISEWKNCPLDFSGVFEVLAIISDATNHDDCLYYSVPDSLRPGYVSKTEPLFMKFIETAIEEVVTTAFPKMVTYVSSSIINVKRLYPLEANDEFTTLIKRYMRAKTQMSGDVDYVPNTFMNKWMKAFGIGETASIEVDSEGLGATLRLYSSVEDKCGMLLADNGYGITQLFSILLNIEVAIMERVVTTEIPANVYSPSIYVSSEDRISVYSSPFIAIEEPEIHLHPSMQSKLAEMFCDAYLNYGIRFIIETHSEYLIRRFQKDVALYSLDNRSGIAATELSVYYLYAPDSEKRPNGEPQIKKILIREDGRLMNPFGSGFFDESSALSMDLLSIKAKRNG